MTDLISIIIPIYNIKDYLPRCLNSILHQTYRNYEVILVDDALPTVLLKFVIHMQRWI